MENLLRNGVDLQGMYNAKTINGDAHFFEDVTTPAKVRQYLDSFQVDSISLSLSPISFFHLFYTLSHLRKRIS